MKTIILENDFQKISFLDVGATIYTWEIKPKNNRNIVLSNKLLSDYLDSKTGYLGATIGRVTNRIKNGVFTLDGVEYTLARNFDSNVNAGHGGEAGFWARPFNVAHQTLTKVVFTYESKDGEEGYPGNLHLSVTYELTSKGLSVKYEAESDQKTIVNITNHSYFNLEASQSILNHKLQLDAPYFLPFDELKAVQGIKAPTKGTALDFSQETRIGDIIHDEYLSDPKTEGLDHCLYFGHKKQVILKSSDLELVVKTSYPCVQLYATGFPGPQQLLSGDKVKKYQALAIEPQLAVDAINFPKLGNIILNKGEKYEHFITYELSKI